MKKDEANPSMSAIDSALGGLNWPKPPQGYSFDVSVLPTGAGGVPDFEPLPRAPEPLRYITRDGDFGEEELDEAVGYLVIGTDEQVIFYFHKSLETKTRREIGAMKAASGRRDKELMDTMRGQLTKELIHDWVRNRFYGAVLEQERLLRDARDNMAFDFYTFASCDWVAEIMSAREDAFGLSRALFDFSDGADGSLGYTEQYLSNLVGLVDGGTGSVRLARDDSEPATSQLVSGLSQTADFYSSLVAYVSNLSQES